MLSRRQCDNYCFVLCCQNAPQVVHQNEPVQSEEEKRREQYMKLQQENYERRQEEMRRLEEARLRELREREQRQPPRPKSAPLNDQRTNQENTQARTDGPQRFATMRRMREERDSVGSRYLSTFVCFPLIFLNFYTPLQKISGRLNKMAASI